MAVETEECRQCGETHKAFENANVAETQYCSPRYEVEGEWL